MILTSMLANFNLPTLQERRKRAKLQMLYKVIHQFIISSHPKCDRAREKGPSEHKLHLIIKLLILGSAQ